MKSANNDRHALHPRKLPTLNRDIPGFCKRNDLQSARIGASPAQEIRNWQHHMP
jgi:hypothetical protein